MSVLFLASLDNFQKAWEIWLHSINIALTFFNNNVYLCWVKISYWNPSKLYRFIGNIKPKDFKKYYPDFDPIPFCIL